MTFQSTVLITGGTGFIGRHLSNTLALNGFKVTHLSRSVSGREKIKTYLWTPDKNFIEGGAIEEADYIIHLAGAGIADKRWTKERKNLIIESRVKTAEILFNKISKINGKIKAFISASAVGYYGTVTSEKIFTEEDPPGNDFTAETCIKWENAADEFSTLGIRTVKLRTAIVLGPGGGALLKLVIPVRYFIGAPLGSGKQYFPWIHIHDLCNIYLMAIINDTMRGAYNAVAPDHITNCDLIKSIAKILDKPLVIPNIPSFALKFALGEMGNAVLRGSRISSEKIIKAGFRFQYSTITSALQDCLK